jgi:hypothetical protein
MIRQAFGEESMIHAQVFELKIPNSPRLKEARLMKGKVNSMLIIFFHMKGIVHEEQPDNPNSNSACYFDVLQ